MLPEEPTAAATEPAAVIPISTDFCANDADVIIRAAGTLDFRAHKAILSLVSPFFKDMFTLPQPPSIAPETLPHVDVEEPPKTWENILRAIYPIPNPTIITLGNLHSLLLAAKKYEMQFIIDKRTKELENRALVQRVPLRLYSIACSCGLDEVAKFVARHADLSTVVKTTQNDCLDILTSALYHRLISFLFARDNELHPILEEGWNLLYSSCGCTLVNGNDEDLYKRTKTELKAPYTRIEEVYLVALEERADYFDKACDSNECSIMAPEIKRFLERMFQERERVCNKFMWE